MKLGDAYMKQAKAEWAVFLSLRESGAPPALWLHCLQTAAEKIAKAYRAESGIPFAELRKSHVALARLIGELGSRPGSTVFGPTARQRRALVRKITQVAKELEDLIPRRGHDRANLEYPWPLARGEFQAPVGFNFSIVATLEQRHGRLFLDALLLAMEEWTAHV